jgi:hypothetical protein
MLRVRDDCDQDLITAKKHKAVVKQQLDSAAADVSIMNEAYEQTKTEVRDLQIAINEAQIALKQIDKEIF